MEAGDIVTSMDTNCTRYKMEFGPDKTKIMTNNPDGRHGQINGQRLDEMKSLEYL